VFRSSAELATQLSELFAQFPRRSSKLDALRDGVSASSSLRWEENWRERAAPVMGCD
jgi:hypothetical protein|tara:strand:+ start:385 stop:555 length:171 start_codon:yes stop_codon:yes gene_type:complete